MLAVDDPVDDLVFYTFIICVVQLDLKLYLLYTVVVYWSRIKKRANDKINYNI